MRGRSTHVIGGKDASALSSTDISAIVLTIFMFGAVIVSMQQVVTTSDNTSITLTDRETTLNHTDYSASHSDALPANVNRQWWSQARTNILQRNYDLIWHQKSLLARHQPAWQAPNLAQRLHSFFTTEGIHITPVGNVTPAWEFSMRFIAYGSPGQKIPVKDAHKSVSKNRISYAYGSISQWFVNDQAGVEHGFVIESADRFPDADILHLELEVSGKVKAVTNDARSAVTFYSHDQKQILQYSKLKVFDAQGKVLPAYLTFKDTKIVIAIETRAARYPITVDPLITGKSAAGSSVMLNGVDTFTTFGFNFAAGDFNGDGLADLAVTAPVNSRDTGLAGVFGTMYVFHGALSGFPLSADVVITEDKLLSEFGRGLATGDINNDGFDDVIVGAPTYDNQSQLVTGDLILPANFVNNGKVDIFYGSAAGLTNTPVLLTAATEKAGLGFAIAVADVNGDLFDDIIVSGTEYDNSYIIQMEKISI